MIERKAIAFACDEVSWTITGKITISGIYTGDISLPQLELRVAQIVFFFIMETDVADPFQTITLRVTLPGIAPEFLPVPIFPTVHNEGRQRVVIRQPFLISNPTLRPGRIVMSLIHERGEIEAGSIWVTTAVPQPI
jgi:hypothetical protein